MQHVKGKEDRVADALSRKIHHIYELYFNDVEFKFQEKVKKATGKDPEYQFLWQQAQDMAAQGKQSDYGINEKEMLIFQGNIFIPNQISLKKLILDEYHISSYVGHRGYRKMLTNIIKDDFWPGMCKAIAEYSTNCLEF